MLIHARGCTAVKLVRIAQKNDIEVVLVQSDPDMESRGRRPLLPSATRVVCIGGNTPDESYLNAMSVLRVAEHERVDSLHPGIGFLSENAQFAELCRGHGINFIGPPVGSMDTMGNKSNAINTAMRLGVPVVPGSHGILTDVERAAEVAEQIGYPVLIKAVHGGGGKGIQVVEATGSVPRALPARRGGSAQRVRQRRRLSREVRHVAAPHRGAAPARRARQHPRAGPARLQRAARQAEGDRGIRVDDAARAT